MLETIRETRRIVSPATNLVAIAGARSAAETAARIAQATAYWVVRSDVAEDDAVDVLAAASRARQAADRAQFATTPAEAWTAAREAWSAITTPKEAEARIHEAMLASF